MWERLTFIIGVILSLFVGVWQLFMGYVLYKNLDYVGGFMCFYSAFILFVFPFVYVKSLKKKQDLKKTGKNALISKKAFVCKKCGKRYPSGQSLGGHRTYCKRRRR